MSPEDLRNEAERLRQLFLEADKIPPPGYEPPRPLLRAQTPNQWMDEADKEPIPNMLFSELWYEGDICIMFADTNLGKSILAVQIADSISKGVAIPGFKMEAAAQPVMYYDFELSKKQFQRRYSHHYTDHYEFSTTMMRAEIDPRVPLPDNYNNYDEFLKDELERSIKASGAKVVIVDNITYLGNEKEQAKDALPFMKELHAMCERLKISLMALAHTPKRDRSEPLTTDSVQGSKMLMNYCDSSFAIGSSQQGKGLRYIKWIKGRNDEEKFGKDDVAVCRIEKPHNFLQFTFVNLGSEREHLREKKEVQREELTEQILALSKEGKTQREIAAQLEIGLATVNRTLKSADVPNVPDVPKE